jgi:hypothetical protein
MSDKRGRALVPYKVQPSTALLPTQTDMAMIASIAQTAAAGGNLLPTIGSGDKARRMNSDEARVVMLYGLELGVRPFAALKQIYIVKNRPEPSAQLMLGLMQSRDPKAGCDILERTTERAKVRLTYRGRSGVFEATMDDAKRAKLTGNATWALYPKQMLVWTAVRTGVRLMAPDAVNALEGLPSVQEAGEMFESVEPYMEGEAVDVTEQEASEPASLTEADEEGITSEPQPQPGPEPQAEGETPIGELRQRVGDELAAKFSGEAKLFRAYLEQHAPNTIDGNAFATRLLTRHQCDEILHDLGQPGEEATEGHEQEAPVGSA